jgi:hypothetical protein
MAGAAYGGYDSPKLTYSGYVKMWQGSNKISILSAAVGLPVSSPQRKFRIFIRDYIFCRISDSL